MGKVREILLKIRTRPEICCTAFFIVVLIMYGAVQAHPSFKDPDSFYHARIAVMTLDQGAVTDFPWLPFTTLADWFADHHFLYHLLLAPFIWLFGPLVGLKAAAAFFGAVAVSTFYFVLYRLRVHWAICLSFSLLLATSMDFMFRMNLAKAASLSVILLLLGTLFVIRGKPLKLFFLSFIYVWTHGSWPLIIAVALAYAVLRVLILRDWRNSLLLPLAAILGSFTGLVANPFFPDNLIFYWYQTVHAALLNYGQVINVGVEWHSYNLPLLVPQNAAPVVMLCTVAALALFVKIWSDDKDLRKKGEQLMNTRSWQAKIILTGVLTGFFLLMAVRSQRHIEYFVPFAFLFSALWLDYLRRHYDLKRLVSLSFSGNLFYAKFVGVVLALFFLAFSIRDSVMVFDSFHSEEPDHGWDKFEKVSDWMNGHLPAGSIVYHGCWADFPPLFYHAPQFEYIAGLDPTFLYLKDPAMFVEWRAVSLGRVHDVSGVMRSYGSKYILVSSAQDSLEEAVESDRDLRLVYQDEGVKLFTIFP